MAKGQSEFNEAWMQPSGAYGHKAPESSRVSKTYRSGRTKVRTKGLDRCMVKVVRKSATSYDITLANGGRKVGEVFKHRNKKTSYSYRIVGDVKPHGGFPSQKAALARMLEKI